jgi:hypothetical protein
MEVRMNIQRFLIGITLINLMLLMFLLLQTRRIETRNMGSVLRGSSLEIVDDQNRVRASIKIQPVDPKDKTDAARAYPDTVILRLVDEEGRPYVKLGGSKEGSGLALIGLTDKTHALLKADGKRTLLKLSNDDGHEQFVKP